MEAEFTNTGGNFSSWSLWFGKISFTSGSSFCFFNLPGYAKQKEKQATSKDSMDNEPEGYAATRQSFEDLTKEFGVNKSQKPTPELPKPYPEARLQTSTEFWISYEKR